MTTTRQIPSPVIVAVRHSCGERIHTTDFTSEEVTVLGCGCTRHRGRRCDGTRMEVLSPVVCSRHQDDEAEGQRDLDEAASR
jgi:hypothetical protein